MDKISVVVPCYNEEDVLPLFYTTITDTLHKMRDITYELIFVNDGSKDGTLHLLKGFAKEDSHCVYLSLSRNFGKEAAMYAGLQQSDGTYTVIMDADLQHPPVLLPQMYHAVSKEGYDCAAGKRIDREGEGKLRNFLSRSFYKVIQKLSKLDMSDGAGDFRMMNRTMVNAILDMKEYNRYMKGMYSFVGFDTKWIPFHNIKRPAGETKWNFRSLFSYACEGIFSFSSTPLTIASSLGAMLFTTSMILGMYILIQTFAYGRHLSAWLGMMFIILLLSGIQLFFVGIMGQYLSRDYMENKNRPIYIVKESNRK